MGGEVKDDWCNKDLFAYLPDGIVRWCNQRSKEVLLTALQLSMRVFLFLSVIDETKKIA